MKRDIKRDIKHTIHYPLLVATTPYPSRSSGLSCGDGERAESKAGASEKGWRGEY
jgi:hypothetical protein